MKYFVPILLALLILSSCQSTANDAPEGPGFNSFVDQYFADYSRMHPVEATEWGYHGFDDDLGRYDAKALAEQADFFKKSLKQIEAFREERLGVSARFDRRILEASIHDQLVDLEEVHIWNTRPSIYNDLVVNSILRVIERSYAPKSERLAHVLARERQIPGLLETAKLNLQHPPRAMTEIAIAQFQDAVPFFENIVPRAFQDTSARDLLSELQSENQRVIQALRDFITFLQNHALPEAADRFALGAELLEKKLRYEELIEESSASLQSSGLERLRQKQAEFVETARHIDASRSPIEVVDAVTRQHPTPEALVPEIRNLLEEMRAFCIRRNLVTIPSEVRCEVTETPPFARTLSIGSLDAPGPYEPFAQEAYFKVTLPDPGWSADRREGHLRFFNSAALPTISAFETYPGRYLQYLWSKVVPSKVRRLLQSDFFITGWAHYSEQMVLDEGYRSGDLKVQLAMERNALLRLCRFLTAIGLHTGQMSEEQAVDFFIKEAYQERANAEREVRRSITDPVRAMSYFWGKLEIQRLRDDYQKKVGPGFSIKGFHNELLRHGAPPMPIIREILLSDDPAAAER